MNRISRLRIFFCGLLIFLLSSYSNITQGQGFSNFNWYFGATSFTIQFNKGAPFDPYLDSAQAIPYGINGSGVGTDPVTGELMFYSDGSRILDRTHTTMVGSVPDAPVTGGQGVVVAPVPGNDFRYYVIFNRAGPISSGSLAFSVVDMSLPGNTTFGGPQLGEVITSNQGLPGTVGEGLVVIEKDPLSSGYWMYAQEPGTNNILVYSIVQGGINLDQTISIGTPVNAANLAILRDPADPKLIVSPKGTVEAIQIFDINRSTGAVSNPQSILNTNASDASALQGIFDAEMSFNQNNLFYSEYGGTAGNGRFLAMDLQNQNQTSVSIFPGTLHRSYGMKRAPDGKIYHLYQENVGGPIQVGRIENPEAPIDSIIYTPAVFGNRNFASEQFPATLPAKISLPSIPSIEFIGSCVTDTVYFFADFDPLSEALQWDYGDGNFPTPLDAISPGYNYTQPSTYNVSVQSFLGGTPSPAGQISLPIGDTQLMIDLGQDTVICPGETLTLEIDPQTAAQLQNIVWSTGETGVPSITIDESGDYWVSADAGTCTLHDAIRVDVYGEIKQVANIWYFGDRAGLDFNENPPVALDNSIMNAPEGTATISDRNGDVLFYTDGQTIYNRDDQEMVNGDNLVGNPSSAQSSIIVQFPGDETLFYVFTTRCVDPFGACQNEFQMDYSVVDMKADPGGNGRVVIKNKPLFQRSTERMTAIGFGNNVWLIAHEFGTNTFRAYPITDLGIQAPVLSSVGSIHSRSIERNGGGYMKISADGTKLAVALAGSGTNAVELFDFDVTTGEVTNPVILDLASANGKVYGVEFSPSSEYLYVTTTNIPDGGNSQLFQYHVDSTTIATNTTDPSYIQGSQTEVTGSPTGESLGAIQAGPNGILYVAVNGSGSLASINNPNAGAQGNPGAPGFNLTGQPLAGGTTSGLGLPNFIQNNATQPSAPTATVQPFACTGEPIAFSATSTSIIDMFQWEVFDSSNQLVASSMNQGDTITLNQAGDYTFTVRIFNRCVDPIAIISSPVTVSDPPGDPLLPNAVPICDQAITLTAYPSLAPTDPSLANLTYLWSTGETTKSITVTTIGTYSLTVTDTVTGCTFDDQSFVGPPFGVDLGPDITICEGDVVNLDSQANADDYIWTVNGDTLQAFSTSRILDLGQVTYPPLVTGNVNTIIVGVIDPINPTCIVTDTVEVTINPLPIATFTPSQSDCLGATGSIQIDMVSVGDFDYTINGPQVRSGSIFQSSPTALEDMLPGGVYSVILTDRNNGCSDFFGGIIIDEPSDYEVTSTVPMDLTSCTPDPPNGSIEVTLAIISGVEEPFPINYILSEQTTGQVFPEVQNVGTAGDTQFTIPDLAAGTYDIEISSTNPALNGCRVFASNIVINDPPQADLQTPTTISDCAPEIVFADLLPDPSDPTAPFTISSADTDDPTEFFWSLDQNFTTEFDFNTPFNIPGTSTVFIKVSLASKPPCDSIRQVEVTVTPPPEIEIVEDRTQVCDGIVLLTANITNGLEPQFSFNYQWSTGDLTQTITVTDQTFQNGQYDVTAVHTNNQSCFGTDDIIINVIPPPPGVSLASDPACTDQEFTIGAQPTGGSTTDFTYAWFLDGNQLPESTQSITRLNSPGTYSVEITNNENCTATDQLTITVNDPTPSLLEPLYTFCPEETGSIEIEPGNTFLFYEWSDDNGNLISRDPIFVTSDAGNYIADLTNGFQCITSDFFEVVEDCVPKIVGPNAFRPTSGISDNQTFFLFTEFVDTFQILIFNRWGELIYQSTDKDFRWDGVYNGVLQPTGVYTYIVKYTKEFGDTETVLEQYGGVTLLR